jgi:ribonuclease BN (tRNA processing enzyme)
MRYLSPPLFPVSLREIWSDMHFHELPAGTVEIDEFLVDAHLVIHPNPTVGFRVMEGDASLVYLPDHEPALSSRDFPADREWTSGYKLAEGADLLIHDSQYTREMYEARVGFGHSSLVQAMQFAGLAEVRHLVPFHHDPTHGDDMLDRWFEDTIAEMQPRYRVTPAQEGQEFPLGEA